MHSISEKNRIILPPEEDLPADSASFIRWMLFFLKPYGRTLGAFFCVRVVRYTILMLLPLAIGLTIKAFESGFAHSNPGFLIGAAAAYMFFYGISLLSVQVFFFESATQDRAVRGMTLFAVRHMNSLPLGWHEAEGSGGKLQRVMTARASMKQIFDIYKWDLVPFAGSVLAITISVFTIDAPPFMLLYYLGFILSFCAAGWHYARPLPALHNRHNALLEKLVSGVYEFIGAVRTVKSFSMESYIERKADAHEREGHDAMRNIFQATFFKWTILNAIGYFWILVFFITCITGIYGGWLGIGAFATIFFLADNLWRTLENLVYVQDRYIEHRNGFMRLTEMLKEKPAALDKEPVVPMPEDWRTIRFEKAGYRYRGAGKAALHDITLEIKRGEKVALVGASGAGKSTLVRLLMKQALPDSGALMIDRTDLAHIEGSAWVGQCGFVPQDVELFNMSIRDNILLDRIDEIDEAVYRSALRQAAFENFMDSLPEGDATIIGERGIKLSGGQRQRLGIARALVRQAELIVFDEATSALDSLSEQAIQEAIAESFAGKTLVVIAHRLSTVRHVDRIFVLDQGLLVEEGSFDDLVKKDGVFAKLWALQSGGFTC